MADQTNSLQAEVSVFYDAKNESYAYAWSGADWDPLLNSFVWTKCKGPIALRMDLNDQTGRGLTFFDNAGGAMWVCRWKKRKSDGNWSSIGDFGKPFSDYALHDENFAFSFVDANEDGRNYAFKCVFYDSTSNKVVVESDPRIMDRGNH